MNIEEYFVKVIDVVHRTGKIMNSNADDCCRGLSSNIEYYGGEILSYKNEFDNMEVPYGCENIHKSLRDMFQNQFDAFQYLKQYYLTKYGDYLLKATTLMKYNVKEIRKAIIVLVNLKKREVVYEL